MITTATSTVGVHVAPLIPHITRVGIFVLLHSDKQRRHVIRRSVTCVSVPGRVTVTVVAPQASHLVGNLASTSPICGRSRRTNPAVGNFRAARPTAPHPCSITFTPRRAGDLERTQTVSSVSDCRPAGRTQSRAVQR